MEEHVVKPIFSPIKSEPIKDVDSKQQEEGKETTPIKQEEEHSQTKKSVWDSTPPTSDPYYQSDPLFFKVADYLGMNERVADLNKNKIIDIINWGRNSSPTKDDADVLLRIKEVETNIGRSPGFSERRYAILHRYLSLQKQKEGIEKEMSVWQRGGNI